jgi:hypothetical protein
MAHILAGKSQKVIFGYKLPYKMGGSVSQEGDTTGGMLRKSISTTITISFDKDTSMILECLQVLLGFLIRAPLF